MFRKRFMLLKEQNVSGILSRRSGFTLIELLVVIAIMLVLMSFIITVIPKVRLRRQITQALHDMNQIEIAFTGYFNEYKRWPRGLTGYDIGLNVEGTTTGIQVEKDVLRMLGGENINSMNPRLIPFFEFQSKNLDSSGSLSDPWGNPYKYMMDYNQDDVLHIEFTSNDWSTNFVKKGVAIWSRGRDGSDMLTDGGHADDVTTW